LTLERLNFIILDEAGSLVASVSVLIGTPQISVWGVLFCVTLLSNT
jgi:hypothetical protein